MNEQLNQQNQTYDNTGSIVVFAIVGIIVLYGIQKLYYLFKKPEKLNECSVMSAFLGMIYLILPSPIAWMMNFCIPKNAMQILVLASLVLRIVIGIVRLKINNRELSNSLFFTGLVYAYTYRVSCLDKYFLYGIIFLLMVYLFCEMLYISYIEKKENTNEKTNQVTRENGQDSSNSNKEIFNLDERITKTK